MDQVVDEIHPVNGAPEITLDIALDDLDLRPPWGAIKFLGCASEAPHLISGIEKLADKPTPDITGCTGH
jgi:hypothetical protein